MTKDIDEGVTGKTVPGRPWRELYDKKERAFREKKQQDYAKSKGFNVKRDKGGKGFSFSMHKKIKGFEEEADMGNKQVDEAEGIATVSTKGYSGSKRTKPSNRPGTKGFINYKAGKPAAEADEKVLAHHKSEAAKEGKVVQLRYRGPRSHAGRQTYNPGASQTRGAATGAAIYYKNKSELGGRQRDKARSESRYNEEYEIEYVDQIDETSLKKAIDYQDAASIDFSGRDAQASAGTNVKKNTEVMKRRWKGLDMAGRKIKKLTKEEAEEDDEVQEPMIEVSDLIVHSIDQKPLDFQQSFYDLMQQRIEDEVHNKKLEIASAFVANTEPLDVDFEDADPEDDDSDWDGTEYESDEEDLTPGEPDDA